MVELSEQKKKKKRGFPCKGRGMNNREYQLAGLKDPIKVLAHAESPKDWPAILSANPRFGVRVNTYPLGVLGDL